MSTPSSPHAPSSNASVPAPNAAPASGFQLFPLRVLQEKKERGETIAMISLYDAPSAVMACDAGADVLLVGDSLGNVVLGYDNTIPVSMQDMVRHTGAVVRGVRQSARPWVPVVADLPFGSYAGSAQTIADNARALMQVGAHALKIEGAHQSTLNAVQIMRDMGAPVMGHIGFTPQAVLGFTRVVQGRSVQAARDLWDAAFALQAAGCCAIVMEAVPVEVTHAISSRIDVPIIGIGAGVGCDGQVLVWHDLVGLSPQSLRFSKAFAQAREVLSQAAVQYVQEVHSREFPAVQHGWNLSDDERAAWNELTAEFERRDTSQSTLDAQENL
ncbi:MAG: 3-methyl-2-oxobutanoate hydroxymethyltransferase [Abditibacteriota bacterium]|nr:3-methyl-2-oxobutanoate hydroxymethyltransferase [Abditibacteriota bacterium]